MHSQHKGSAAAVQDHLPATRVHRNDAFLHQIHEVGTWTPPGRARWMAPGRGTVDSDGAEREGEEVGSVTAVPPSRAQDRVPEQCHAAADTVDTFRIGVCGGILTI